MERPKIFGKIVKIEPDSGYQGIVYDQIVWIELRNGSILCLQDYRMLVPEKMLGQDAELTITAFLPKIEKIDEQKFSVVSNIKDLNDDYLSDRTQFYGRIEWIDEKRDTIYLNIGIGFVEVNIQTFEIKQMKIGDFVKTDGYRIDLNAVYPD